MVSVTLGYRQLTRSRRIETAVLPERQGYEPPTKEGLLSPQENLKTSQKSNDDDNVEMDEQSAEELNSELLPE